MMHVMLVGNPNCGKTTLFNALTGENQRVGNWPGVTVEKRVGAFSIDGQTVEVSDLPGVYSLVTSSIDSSLDAQIAARAVLDASGCVILNVIDACHLERHLYLTSQLLELNLPMMVVINMTDLAALQGITIDAKALAHALGCPVMMLQAHRQVGVAELKSAILAPISLGQSLPLSLPFSVKQALVDVERELIQHHYSPGLAPYLARRVAEGDTLFTSMAMKVPDMDILMADARYEAIHQIVDVVQTKKTDTSEQMTAKLDRVFLHRFFALPLFFCMMYLMFFLSIQVGGVFQDFFNIASDALFVQAPTWLLQRVNAPGWLIALGANGIGKGINTTLTFIPVMASMYFFLSLLEASGYMARAAFVVDKAMRLLGLPGKSFVPMIVGFGCNVPAIMAARTLDSERDRVLTVLMSPFMSCSARLAIYAVFVAAFFPTGGQNVIFSLYLIGILMAVLTGFLLRKTLLKGSSSPLILELPAYHRPSFRRLMKETQRRVGYFLTRAAKFIIPVCVIISGLNGLTLHGEVTLNAASGESVLSFIGQWLTPVFSPMGIHQDNWPATVGLLTGTLAKEVVVGSLNTLYAQMGHQVTAITPAFDLWDSLYQAVASIGQNITQLSQTLFRPDGITGHVSESVYGTMYQRFDGKAGAYAYLLFILLYIPCVSTMAAIRQETHSSFMWFSIGWSLWVAYVTAVIFYQIATFSLHVEQTLIYCGILLLSSVGMIWIIHRMAKPWGGRYVIEPS